MDDATRSVMAMYRDFPYPSVEVERGDLLEMIDLLRVLSLETRTSIAGKRVLDAGTGTGRRLAKAALAFPEARFTAVDLCEAALGVARRVGEKEGVENVRYDSADLMGDLRHLGMLDLVLCVGVLHHLAAPAIGLRNLAAIMEPGGMLVLWLYGERGGRERNRRKRVIRELLHTEANDFTTGIRVARDLGFADDFELGWALQGATARERDGMIVDALLNVNEKLCDIEDIQTLMRDSRLAGYVVFSIVSGNALHLVDTSLDGPKSGFRTTDVTKHMFRFSVNGTAGARCQRT